MKNLSMIKINALANHVCIVMLSGALQSVLSEEGICGTGYIGLQKIVMGSRYESI